MYHFKTYFSFEYLKLYSIFAVGLVLPVIFNSCKGFEVAPVEEEKNNSSSLSTTLQDLKAIAISANEIQLSWALNESGNYAFSIFRNDQYITTTINTNYTDVELTANTNYTYKVFAADTETGLGHASGVIVLSTPDSEQTTEPTPEEPPTPAPDLADKLWFYDDFESGTLSKSTTRTDSSWTWSTNSSSGGVIRPSSTITHSGNYAIEAMYDADPNGEDSHPELIFRFGKSLSEVWVEYYVYYPSNYYHRTQSSSSNNKFLQLGYQMLTIESSAAGDGSSNMRRFLSVTQKPNGSNNWPVTDTDTSKFIGPGSEYAIQLGQWTQIRVHYKSGSDGIKNDGHAAIYINGQLYHSLNWPFWEPQDFGHISKGYLPGWSNSGFANQTSIYIDDFKVYDKNPNW